MQVFIFYKIDAINRKRAQEGIAYLEFLRVWSMSAGGICSIEVNCETLEVCKRAITQGTFMGGPQDDSRCVSGLQCLVPPRRAQTPAITGFQSGKAKLGNWS